MDERLDAFEGKTIFISESVLRLRVIASGEMMAETNLNQMLPMLPAAEPALFPRFTLAFRCITLNIPLQKNPLNRRKKKAPLSSSPPPPLKKRTPIILFKCRQSLSRLLPNIFEADFHKCSSILVNICKFLSNQVGVKCVCSMIY